MSATVAHQRVARPHEPGHGHRTRRVAAGLAQRLDLVAVMTTVIIAGVIGYVGVQLMQNTHDTAGLSFNSSTPSQNTGFENASHDFTVGLEDFFSQLGTVFTVIVLVVIIGYLMLLRGR